MGSRTFDVIVLGAGMAGLATAYHLATRHRVHSIAVVDERPPLTLTSSRGTMAYRNWFPGPGTAMVELLNRSIELLRELDAKTGKLIRLSQGGYVYLTARETRIQAWRGLANDGAQRGVGQFREHASNSSDYVPAKRNDWRGMPDGVDLITDSSLIRRLIPSITPDAIGMLHIRRAGTLDALALGHWQAAQVRQLGAEIIQDRVERITQRGGRVDRVRLGSGKELGTDSLVIAAGPLLPEIGKMLQLDFPVYNELHGKLTMRDQARVFPRYGDLLLWDDPQVLNWDQSDGAKSRSDETTGLMNEFPAGAHYLPKGTEDDPTIMALWTYDIKPTPYIEPPKFEPHYAEIVLRGLERFVPAAKIYIGRAKEAVVDGGYYCKTRENRPLIGPLPVQGAFVCGALSGFGVMASQAVGELASAHVAGAPLPEYAASFFLSRYDDPNYIRHLDKWDARSGQL